MWSGTTDCVRRCRAAHTGLPSHPRQSRVSTRPARSVRLKTGNSRAARVATIAFLALSVAAGAVDYRAVATNSASTTSRSFAQEGATDFVAQPPARTESVSPNARYVLVIESLDGWKTKHAVARLLQQTAAGRSLVWERTLPQEYGPRYALVGNEGRAVLFDEWINVKSRYAIAILGNPGKNPDVMLDFDTVASALATPIALIVREAATGWWMAGKPTLARSGTAAVVSAARKCVWIELNTGHLAVRDATRNGCPDP